MPEDEDAVVPPVLLWQQEQRQEEEQAGGGGGGGLGYAIVAPPLQVVGTTRSGRTVKSAAPQQPPKPKPKPAAPKRKSGAFLPPSSTR